MAFDISIPRFMIAAPGSGSGKTLVTCAVLRILERMQLRAASFKCGPDFIDPMFHRSVLQVPSRNVDLFLAGEEGVRKTLLKGSSGREAVKNRDTCLASRADERKQGLGT